MNNDYMGELTYNNKTGIGVIINNKFKYSGEFKNNMFNGHGIYICLVDQKKYVGFFKNNLKCGNFKIYDLNNNLLESCFYSNE